MQDLNWFTDLDEALHQARRTARPILSLRLLGRLDEELSCANSRFFRKLLYPDRQINTLMRERFVLHWESVRPVPKVTIDFGNGRRIVKTITGNSAHVVIDPRAPRGRAVDVLPGLFDKSVFVELLEQSLQFARADARQLPQLHAFARGRFMFAPPMPSRAMRASTVAMTKHMVEAPILRAFELPDTHTNLELHDCVHDAFAARAEWAGIAGLVEWVYAELFQMPLGDPALGLDVPDPFGDYMPKPPISQNVRTAGSPEPKSEKNESSLSRRNSA